MLHTRTGNERCSAFVERIFCLDVLFGCSLNAVHYLLNAVRCSAMLLSVFCSIITSMHTHATCCIEADTFVLFWPNGVSEKIVPRIPFSNGEAVMLECAGSFLGSFESFSDFFQIVFESFSDRCERLQIVVDRLRFVFGSFSFLFRIWNWRKNENETKMKRTKTTIY